MSLIVPAWPKRMVSGSPRHHWHLGPVTADGAEWRSAAGCCSRSRSLGTCRGKSRESSLPVCSPGGRETERASVSVAVRAWHLSPALKLAAVDAEGGGRGREEGGASQTIKTATVCWSGNFQLENLLKNSAGAGRASAKPAPLFHRGDVSGITELFSGRIGTRIGSSVL